MYRLNSAAITRCAEGLLRDAKPSQTPSLGLMRTMRCTRHAVEPKVVGTMAPLASHPRAAAQESDHGSLATRSPRPLPAELSEPMTRFEERTDPVPEPHDAPRSTRAVPLAGPVGFTIGLEE